MVKGTVKWFNSRKGYGFINSEEGNDIFVHYTALAGRENEYITLNENDKVEFEVVQGQKGPQANNVIIVEKAPQSPYKRGFRI
ncbi:MAG: cold-shock protein [Promethearchaeota archaeon]